MKYIYLLICSFMVSCQGSAQSFEGIWKGVLDIQGNQLPLIIGVENANSYNAWLQSPTQSPQKISASSISVKEDSVFIGLESLKIAFSGKINASGDSIFGIFKQAGMTLPLNLARGVQEDSEAPKRIQTVNPPYPYDTLDVNFKNITENITLVGTLTQPKASGKYPAVILVSGSGPQNRNEELMNHEPFKVLADYLTRKEIVVLRYDDRGIGQSEGNFVKSNIANFSKDALAAIDFLRRQDKVDSTNVGIIGHSEGGLIAYLLAGQHLPGINFIVSLAGPSVPLDQLMVEQLYAVGKVSGISEVELERLRPVNQRNFEILKSDADYEEAKGKIIENLKGVVGDSDTRLNQEIEVMLMEPYRYFIRVDPVPFIQKIKIPVFAAFGELDVQVPHSVNMESLADHLPRNSKSEIKTYPKLNHLFQPAKSGAVGEYYEIETTIDPSVLKDVADWVKSL